MKFTLLALLAISLPVSAHAEDPAPAVNPVELCKLKVTMAFHQDMLAIERRELSGQLIHSAANEEKQARTMDLESASSACEKAE